METLFGCILLVQRNNPREKSSRFSAPGQKQTSPALAMSALGGKADSFVGHSGCPLIARSGHPHDVDIRTQIFEACESEATGRAV